MPALRSWCATLDFATKPTTAKLPRWILSRAASAVHRCGVVTGGCGWCANLAQDGTRGAHPRSGIAEGARRVRPAPRVGRRLLRPCAQSGAREQHGGCG